MGRAGSPEASLLGVQTAASSPCPSVYVRVLTSSSHKDSSPVGLGPTLVTSFYFIYLFKGPISKYSCIQRGWALGYPLMNLEAGEHR